MGSDGLIGSLATLVIVVLAISLVLGGTKGPATLGRASGVVFGRTLRIAAGLFFAAVDTVPTLAIIAYHSSSLQAHRIPDDVAAYVSRCVDKAFRTLVP